MKTPREVLFQRHQAAETKLNAIRHAVLESTRRPSPLNWPILLWRELVWPCRQVWAGLAAVWILILLFNLSQRDPSELMAQRTPPPALEMTMTFPQQEKLLAELMGPDEPRVAVPPKPFSPRPSSERLLEALTV